MIADMTGMDISNASLLDEGLAAAESLILCSNFSGKKQKKVLISTDCFEQTIGVCTTRLLPLGLHVIVTDDIESELDDSVCGVLLQYPATNGTVKDFSALCDKVHAVKGKVVMASDLLACTILKPPGEMGADVVVGTNQRFGVPMGFGGPHAGFLATKDEFKRKMPGRLIGVSIDSRGKKGMRLSLQTREQHIRRDKATSNICTAQALLANISAAYAIYHGPKGLENIGNRVHDYACTFADGVKRMGMNITSDAFFDTVEVAVQDARRVMDVAEARGINVRPMSATSICVSFDETTTDVHVQELLEVLGESENTQVVDSTSATSGVGHLRRTSSYLDHPTFNAHHYETAMMRYMYTLEKRDLGLNSAAIPLGSCTMKSNAATFMVPAQNFTGVG